MSAINLPPNAPKPQSLSEMAWARFKRNGRALGGLWIIAILSFIAILAPFLANNRPYLMSEDGVLSSPLLRGMTAADWRYLVYGLALAFILLFFRRSHGLLRWHSVIALVILVEGSLFFFHQPILDATDYKQSDAEWMILPPIPYGPYETSNARFSEPTAEHWFGTDSLGRDITTRMLHGARISLSIGFVAQGIALVIGVLIGALAGYFRGKIDIIASRLIEIMECFPTFFLIITVIAFLPPSLFNIMIVIGLTSWTGVARLVRAECLRISVLPYVAAAQTAGANHARVLLRHVVPNAMGPILVSATFGVASAILVESALSFLGFGVPPPTPTWGDILAESRKYIDFAWWLATFPGIAIFVTITSYNLAGEGLRDAIDPRMRT